MPRLFIIAGCNGSGKTTASYTLLPERLDCSEFVNSDEFAKGLSPSDPESASIMAGRFMLMKIHHLLDRKADFCIESTLATRSLVNLIHTAQDAGYTVSLIYLWIASPELAIERVRSRVAIGGHAVREETVRRRFHAGIKNFFEIYKDVCDNWTLADNSEPPMRVVAEGNRTRILIRDSDVYQRITQTK